MITIDSAEFIEARKWSSASDENLIRRLDYATVGTGDPTGYTSWLDALARILASAPDSGWRESHLSAAQKTLRAKLDRAARDNHIKPPELAACLVIECMKPHRRAFIARCLALDPSGESAYLAISDKEILESVRSVTTGRDRPDDHKATRGAMKYEVMTSGLVTLDLDVKLGADELTPAVAAEIRVSQSDLASYCDERSGDAARYTMSLRGMDIAEIVVIVAEYADWAMALRRPGARRKLRRDLRHSSSRSARKARGSTVNTVSGNKVTGTTVGRHRAPLIGRMSSTERFGTGQPLYRAVPVMDVFTALGGLVLPKQPTARGWQPVTCPVCEASGKRRSDAAIHTEGGWFRCTRCNDHQLDSVQYARWFGGYSSADEVAELFRALGLLAEVTPVEETSEPITLPRGQRSIFDIKWSRAA